MEDEREPSDEAVHAVPLEEPRALTARERAILDFLASGPLGQEALRAQAEAAMVVSECSRGCPSVWLAIDEAAPDAVFTPELEPHGSAEYFRISAYQEKARGETEAALHVVDGRITELEIWAGQYGVRPRVDVSRLRHDLAIEDEV